MIDEVWDYVFCRTQLTDDIVAKSGIPKETLEAMRRQFEYFYPLDLRCSGKDLIPNHLTFFLYNHIGMCSYRECDVGHSNTSQPSSLVSTGRSQYEQMDICS